MRFQLQLEIIIKRKYEHMYLMNKINTIIHDWSYVSSDFHVGADLVETITSMPTKLVDSKIDGT